VWSRNTFAFFVEGLPNAFEHHAKVFFVLDELYDIDDDLPRPRVGHDALHLAHFMEPKLSQIFIDGRSGLPPEFKAAVLPRYAIFDLEHHRSQRLSISWCDYATVKIEAVIKRWLCALGLSPSRHTSTRIR